MTNVLTYLKLAYNEAIWRAVFGVSRKIVEDIQIIATPTLEHVCALHGTRATTHWQSVKFKCLSDARVWVGYLERQSTFAELEAQLQRLTEDNMHRGLFCDASCGLMRYIEKSCQEGLQEAKSIKFTSFLYKEE